ncbi:MAG TPA: VWA domain-containing protein [Blastocatellia bacterium]|nr:VWA domain-containing protein [Blastocatellia bacterium]
MNSLSRLAFAVILALASVATATRPVGAQKPDQTSGAIKLESNLVAVDAAVLDKNGNYVRNLKAEDFVVTDDGAPQPIGFFEASEQAEETRPLAVVFSLDVSGSIQPEEIVKQRDAADSFIRLLKSDSQFAVITFNYRIRVVQNFTSDPAKISHAFMKTGSPEGSTRLFASIDQAVTMLQRGPQFRGGRRLRRVVIVITDGYDSVDSVDQRALIRRANDAGVTVYSITLPSYIAGQNRRALTLLDASMIVEQTGGTDFSADSNDFSPAFKALAQEIRSSYTLAYYPPESIRHDGRVHQIRVQVEKPGLIVRASRQSYVATK